MPAMAAWRHGGSAAHCTARREHYLEGMETPPKRASEAGASNRVMRWRRSTRPDKQELRYPDAFTRRSGQRLQNYSSWNASSRPFLIAGSATISTSAAAASSSPSDNGRVKNTV